MLNKKIKKYVVMQYSPVYGDRAFCYKKTRFLCRVRVTSTDTPVEKCSSLDIINNINPLTAGADYICFLHFLLARSLSAFKHIEDRM